jgi:DNA adenine methylase
MPRHLHYVEPFFGGGRVLFRRDPADRRLWSESRTSDNRKPDGVSEVINDIDGDLMNFYTVLKDAQLFGRLRQLLELTLHSEAEWLAACQALRGSGPGDPVERAAALFVCCRQSLSGRKDAFAPTTRTRLRGGRNGGVNEWWGAVEGLSAFHNRLKAVKVLCRPALDVIRSEDTEVTLFYCDPPYLHETRTARGVYGDQEMSEADHGELLEALKECKGKVILSGYPSRLYDEALAGWNRHAFDLPNNAAGGAAKRRMTEVVWCNF